MRAYEYRLYPTKTQQVLLNKHFGCCRFVYNYFLAERMEAYTINNKALSYFDTANMLTNLKRDGEHDWLAEVGSQSLQASLRHLDAAYTRFFREKKGFPRFKNKHSKQSFQCPQTARVDFETSRIYIPKFMKEGIKAKFHRTFSGTIKTVTVKKTPTGKYFASILVEDGAQAPNKPVVTEQTTLGIDLGIKHFATLSDGTKIANPKIQKKYLYQLKLKQRQLQKKQKGSKRKEKARLAVAKLHEKIANIRKDFLHKLTYQLTHENQVSTVVLEDLNIAGMMRNHKLARSIADVSWSKFNEYLTYKCEWYGKNLLRIGRFEPSSRMCSTCGTINQELTLDNRVWTCKSCKSIHDRDINAATNIKKIGLHKQNFVYSGLERSEELVEDPLPGMVRGDKRRPPSRHDSLKREA